MPSRVVLALDEPEFAEAVKAALAADGYDAVAMPDSMVALNTLSSASTAEVLVTCIEHPPNTPNGVSLALMARNRRPAIKVVFVGAPPLAEFTEGIGAFMASPVTVEDVKGTVIRLLARP